MSEQLPIYSPASPIKPWMTYEDVALFVLNVFAAELGLDRIEPKQRLGGKSGTNWTIDAKGMRESDGGIMVVECRRHIGSPAKQEQMAAFAYRISDLGAFGGIYVNTEGFQKGAQLIADAENVFSVRLTPESTVEHFVVHFLNKFRAGAILHMVVKGEETASGEATNV